VGFRILLILGCCRETCNQHFARESVSGHVSARAGRRKFVPIFDGVESCPGRFYLLTLPLHIVMKYNFSTLLFTNDLTSACDWIEQPSCLETPARPITCSHTNSTLLRSRVYDCGWMTGPDQQLPSGCHGDRRAAGRLGLQCIDCVVRRACHLFDFCHSGESRTSCCMSLCGTCRVSFCLTYPGSRLPRSRTCNTSSMLK